MNECKYKDMTMDVSNKMSLYFKLFYLSLISNTLFEVSSSAVIKCSASDNERWSQKRQMCVQCKRCPAGYFRNSSEPYTKRTGEHGPEQCKQCKVCAPRTYSANGFGECIKCSVNCTELDREYDEPCSITADAKCGSCLSGFEDIFKNTKFPCAPKSPRSPRLLITSKKRAEETQKKQIEDPASITELQNDQVADGETNDFVSKSSQKNISTGKSNILTMVIAGACGIVLIGVGVPTATVFIRRRHRSRQPLPLSNQGEGNRAALSHDNDIEEDANADYDQTVPKGYHQLPQTEPALVCSELIALQNPTPHPELTINSQSTDNLEGFIYLSFSDGTHYYVVKKYSEICQCREDRKCSCESYTYPSTINIEKSDTYVLEVAANVCHDPIPLVRDLGLENPIIYQENDTRNRDPEKISQKELVVNLLNRLIEVKSSPVTLQQLSKSLCKSNFHSINDKLYNLYCKDISSQTQ